MKSDESGREAQIQQVAENHTTFTGPHPASGVTSRTQLKQRCDTGTVRAPLSPSYRGLDPRFGSTSLCGDSYSGMRVDGSYRKQMQTIERIDCYENHTHPLKLGDCDVHPATDLHIFVYTIFFL